VGTLCLSSMRPPEHPTQDTQVPTDNILSDGPAAWGEIAARELQLAAERNADQRMFLHELRLVGRFVITSSPPSFHRRAPETGLSAMARVNLVTMASWSVGHHHPRPRVCMSSHH